MIKAWTKVRADSWDRYFRIRRILYKWKNPDLQVLWMLCYVEEIVWKVIIIACDHLLVSKMPEKRRKNEKNRLFQDIRIQTILDKSPWDSTAIFIISCHFMIVENEDLRPIKRRLRKRQLRVCSFRWIQKRILDLVNPFWKRSHWICNPKNPNTD